MNRTGIAEFFQKYFFHLAAVSLSIRFIIVLVNFNFVLTDNDQVLFWVGCDNFSRGVFYTPFIYGCNYGSMLESFMALPFYLTGVPLYFALPLSNAFWLFVLCVFAGHNMNNLKPKHHTGTLFIVFLSLLPTECFAILFAAKGHLAGIIPVLAAFILIAKSLTRPALISAGLLTGLAYQLNPNSVFLIACLFLFIPDIRRALFVAAGISGSFLYLLVTSYYSRILDTEFLHKQWKVTHQISFLKSHLDYLDKYLNTVTPLFEKMGFISLLLPVILSISFFVKKNWFHGSISLLIALLLITSFGFSKVSDGSTDVFFPYSRFYLATAFCNAIIISLILSKPNAGNYYNIMLATSLPLLIIYYLIKTPAEVTNLVNKEGETYAVQRKYVADILENTQWMKQILVEKRQSNPMIVATDYVFYSENLFLSTFHLNGVTNCFENYKQFYWLEKTMGNKKEACDLFLILGFKDRLENKTRDYPQYLYNSNLTPYFLIRNIEHPVKFIENFLKEER